jgi:adenylate cyclase
VLVQPDTHISVAGSEAMMVALQEVPGGQPDEPPAYLIVDDGRSQRRVPIFDQLFVGRECAGISESRRLLIADPQISRAHLEIWLDTAGDQASVIDTSSNGTLLNGVRIERAVPLPLRPGDEIRISDTVLTFGSERFTTVNAAAPLLTQARIGESSMVMVVGDIINFSTISEITDEAVIARSLHTLWHQIGDILRVHHGTLSYYAGDALFAIWELSRFPDAAADAVDFALAANSHVDKLGPELPLRGPDGSPIHMGWGVAQGRAALAAMNRSTDSVIGDAANLVFRLAGLAGRQGRAPVMVTSGVRRAIATQFSCGPGETVEIKGRREKETVFPVTERTPASPSQAAGPTESLVIANYAKGGIADSDGGPDGSPGAHPTVPDGPTSLG